MKVQPCIGSTAKLTVFACALLAAVAAPAADAFKKLSGPQIRSRLAGMTLTDEVHWSESYERNGSFASESMGRKRTGKWRIEDGALCVELTEYAESGCYEVWLDGTKVELRPTGPGMQVEGVLQKPGARR